MTLNPIQTLFQQSLIRIMPPKMIWIPTKSRNKVYIYKSGLKSSIWQTNLSSAAPYPWEKCATSVVLQRWINLSVVLRFFGGVIRARCIRTICLSACRRMKKRIRQEYAVDLNIVSRYYNVAWSNNRIDRPNLL